MGREGKIELKVIVVFGTRPEAIKMCPLILELKKHSEIECVVCLTGQHKEMLAQVMNVFKIKEDYNLNIMKPNQTLTGITTSVLSGMESVFEKEKPDLVLVHGDTTTSYAVAMSAFYHRIPIGHVEAGLRTYNMNSPFPEEFNRQAIDLVTDLYFAPTENARIQLMEEKKSAEKIFVTGNTVIDALKFTVKEDYYSEELEWAKDSRLILVTAHRRENIGTPMRNIFNALNRIVDEFEDVKIVYPIHKNPKVREIADSVIGKNERIHIIEPLDVLDFHNFMSGCYFIMTDSGGIQEEAPALGKPVLVMRDTTERPEGIAAGTLKLVGTEEETIYREAKKLLNSEDYYNSMSKARNPYGDGFASQRIVEEILKKINCE